MDPQIRPWDVATRSQTEADTGLIKLADLKRQQASEALLMERIQNDPELRQRLFGDGSIIGSLQTAPGGMPGAQPAPGPITQSPLGGGAAQQLPASPDLSRFAQVPPQGGGPIPPDVLAQTMPTMTPPQGGSVLGALGPSGGMPGPQQQSRNPLLELAARDPRTALLLQQQLEGRQDAAMKRQEQQLKMGTQIMDYLGRGAQGVSDQNSLDAFRQDVMTVNPRAAASLPQMYSKEAMAPFIAKALDVKEAMTLQVQDLTAQAAVIRARKEGRSVDVDNQLRAMGVQPGQETPGQIKEALQAVQEGKIAVSSAHGQGQLKDVAGGVARIGKSGEAEYIRGPDGQILQPKPTQAETETATYSTLARQGHTGAVELEKKGFKPGFWAKAADKLPLHMGNYLTSDDYQKYKDYVTDFAQAWLRRTSKGLISESEWKLVDERYFPQPGNSKAQVEQKRVARENVIKELEAEGKGTGRTGPQGQPTSQAPAAPTGKPVGQMSREELLAERDRLRKGGG